MGRRRLSRREALALDVLLVVGCAVTGIWRETAFPPSGVRMLDLPTGWYAAAQIPGALALLWRRSRPLQVTGLQAVLNLLSPTQASLVMAYSLGAHAKRRTASIIAFAVMVLTWCLGAQLWRLADQLSGPLALIGLFLLGLYLQARRSLIDALADRAGRAERERELLADVAVAAERTHIAREMHDLIAHRISMMVLQAGAARMHSAEGQTAASLEEIRSLGVRTLDELRDMVGVLRTVGLPSAGDAVRQADRHESDQTVAGVVDGARRAGMHIELTESGDEAHLPPPASRALQRVVQEILTNAAKHAPGSAVSITIDHGPDKSVVRATNETRDNGGERTSGGRGLLGLRERLGMLGGSLIVDGDRDGVFEVTATVPVTGSPSERAPS